MPNKGRAAPTHRRQHRNDTTRATGRPGSRRRDGSGSARGRARRRWIIAGCALAVAAGVAGVVLSTGSDTPPRRSTPLVVSVDTNYRACLITPAADVAQPLVTAAWTGMQQQANHGNRRRINDQRFAIPDPTLTDSMLATLQTQHCALIIAVGDSLTGNVLAAARTSPAQQFVLISTVPGTPPPNVEQITATSPTQVTAAVTTALAAAVHHSERH